LAASRYFCNRIYTYPLEKTEKEIQIVKNILHNNQYDTTTVNITCSVKKNKEKGKKKKCMWTISTKNGLLLNIMPKK
jgi:hypothetical protein